MSKPSNLFESENNVLGRSAVAFGLGRVEIREELFAAAHDSLSRARDLFEQVKNLSGEAQTDFYDGAALLGLKQQAAGSDNAANGRALHLPGDCGAPDA